MRSYYKSSGINNQCRFLGEEIRCNLCDGYKHTKEWRRLYFCGWHMLGEITRETTDGGSVFGGQWIVFRWYHDGSRNKEPLAWREVLK